MIKNILAIFGAISIVVAIAAASARTHGADQQVSDQEAREKAFYEAAVPILKERADYFKSLSESGSAGPMTYLRCRVMLLVAMRKLGQLDEKRFREEFSPLRTTIKESVKSWSEAGRIDRNEALDAMLFLEWVDQGLGLCPTWVMK